MRVSLQYNARVDICLIMIAQDACVRQAEEASSSNCLQANEAAQENQVLRTCCLYVCW